MTVPPPFPPQGRPPGPPPWGPGRPVGPPPGWPRPGQLPPPPRPPAPQRQVVALVVSLLSLVSLGGAAVASLRAAFRTVDGALRALEGEGEPPPPGMGVFELLAVGVTLWGLAVVLAVVGIVVGRGLVRVVGIVAVAMTVLLVPFSLLGVL